MSWAQVAPRYMTAMAVWNKTGAQLTPEKPFQQNFLSFN
jgi:hypothetical protein